METGQSLAQWMALALAGGSAAFAHCLGMCGGFALHLSSGSSRRAALGRGMLWHTGRISTYVFLGAIAGFAGGSVRSWASLSWLQDGLAYVAGGVMVLMGCSILGLTPVRKRVSEADGGSGILSSLLGEFFRHPTPAGAAVAGAATGFLPCPVVLAFLAMSVQAGSAPAGMAIMAAMGVGTVWSLLVLGMTGQMLRARLRRWGPVVGGMVVIVLGVTTVLRGTEAFHALLGCPSATHKPAAEASAAPMSAADSAVPECCRRAASTTAPSRERQPLRQQTGWSQE